MNLTFDPDTHVYTLDGVQCPSVTDICSQLSPYTDINPVVLQQAARRGTLVHEYCELLDYGIPLEELEVEPDLQGYVLAYAHFLRDYRPEWQYIERPIANELLGYAGTLDRFGKIGGKLALVDIKTASSATRPLKISWACQLAGYSLALGALGIRPEAEHDLLLKPDGKYTLIDSEKTQTRYNFSAADVFLTLLGIKKLTGGSKWRTPQP